MAAPNFKVPTVRIEADTDSGFIIINAVDFNEDRHKLFVEGQSVAPDPPPFREREGFDLDSFVRADVAGRLRDRGLGTALAIFAADKDDLVAVNGVGARLAERLQSEAADFVVEEL